MQTVALSDYTVVADVIHSLVGTTPTLCCCQHHTLKSKQII